MHSLNPISIGGLLNILIKNCWDCRIPADYFTWSDINSGLNYSFQEPYAFTQDLKNTSVADVGRSIEHQLERRASYIGEVGRETTKTSETAKEGLSSSSRARILEMSRVPYVGFLSVEYRTLLLLVYVLIKTERIWLPLSGLGSNKHHVKNEKFFDTNTLSTSCPLALHFPGFSLSSKRFVVRQYQQVTAEVTSEVSERISY